MLGYDKYEDWIVEQISMAGVEVSPLPLISVLNNPVPVNQPRVYVVFSGSTFEDTAHLGEFAQDETLTFELYIQARTRDGEKGIFAVSDAVMNILIKNRPPHATRRIRLTSFDYARGIQNHWQYYLTFTFPRIRFMPNPEDDEIMIKEINFKV